MTDEWIIYDPEDGWQAADSRADFDAVLDHYRDQGGDGWREDVESLALYRLVPVTTVRLVRIASAEDATEDGERCRAAGWDYLSKLVEDQHEDPLLAACGHPATCLRDGACRWCAAVQDARLALEVRDAAREAAARNLEQRREVEARAIVVERAALARGEQRVGDAIARAEAAEAERDDLCEARDRAREALDEVRAVSDRHQLDAARLRAHVGRLREALERLHDACEGLDRSALAAVAEARR